MTQVSGTAREINAPPARRPVTLLDRLWARHVIVANRNDPGGEELLYVDRNLLHEGGTFLAFDEMRLARDRVRKPAQNLAVTDHYLPSTQRATAPASISNPEIRRVVEALDTNAREFGLVHLGVHDPRQGIIHVVGPELGFTLPGLLITCCDSHTATHGAFGALAIPIGQSTQLRHVLATQTIWQKKPRAMRIRIEGELPPHVTAKDVILAIIARIGIGGAVGHAIEYAGSTIRALSMEGRMTICNMSIEAGGRIGLIAPDEKTFAFIKDRPLSPTGEAWEQAMAYWCTLASDADAPFDKELSLNAAELAPMVSWGTSPEDSSPINGVVPNHADIADANKRARVKRALEYMKLAPGAPLAGIAIDRVFIGSCTNARMEDLRAAATVIKSFKGRKACVPAMVVPGSSAIKREAEAEGLAEIFTRAGFEWRDASCSMCGGSNGDGLAPGERSASTTNRNFEGRQGPGAMTHIMSPAMAAAAAITGHLTDVRRFSP